MARAAAATVACRNCTAHAMGRSEPVLGIRGRLRRSQLAAAVSRLEAMGWQCHRHAAIIIMVRTRAGGAEGEGTHNAHQAQKLLRLQGQACPMCAEKSVGTSCDGCAIPFTRGPRRHA